MKIMPAMKPFYFPASIADDMVRALLDNRKTVTRRVVKPQPKEGCRMQYNEWLNQWISVSGWAKTDEPYNSQVRKGDILYVQETFCHNNFGYHYRADWPDDNCPNMSADDKWRPSIHMPREVARIFLRVTDVYPQRLKDVTENDAKAEGFGSRAEFVATILKMHPDCAEDSWFWANEFERISKEEAERT